jgi:AcrR family transcriptional regulator
VLEAAEQLFTERGYTSVTVKDIAKGAGIHHASLYHHAPGGKEQLYTEVMERHLTRHRQGIADAVREGAGDLRQQLRHVAGWLLSQPPLDLIRMVQSDAPALTVPAAIHLFAMAYEAVLVPLETVLEGAQARGELGHTNMGNIAGALFASIESLHALPDEFLVRPRQEMANELIDVFIAGLKHR